MQIASSRLRIASGVSCHQILMSKRTISHDYIGPYYLVMSSFWFNPGFLHFVSVVDQGSVEEGSAQDFLV